MKKTTLVFFLLALWLGTTDAQGTGPDGLSQSTTVQIPGSKLLKIQSAIVEQEYDIYVQLPGNYGDSTQTFPVIYVLDGQWDFSLVTALYGQQYFDGFIPAAIVVGITWGGLNPDHDKLRERDFTPTNAGPPLSGGAPKFLAFFKSELIPFIDSKYRTARNDRTLMGSSYGGLFTLYAMLHETALFQRYVLTSPALGWDKGITYDYEKTYAENNRRLPVKLYMAIGGFEQTSGFRKFEDQLRTRKYDGFQFQTKTLEGIGHSGSKAEGYTRGLQAVFERPSFTVDPGLLERYAGVYQQDAGMRLTIANEEGRLVASTPDGTKIALHAQSDKDFYVKGQYLFVHFKKDDAGKVDGFQAVFYRGGTYLKRIN